MAAQRQLVAGTVRPDDCSQLVRECILQVSSYPMLCNLL